MDPQNKVPLIFGNSHMAKLALLLRKLMLGLLQKRS